MKKTLIFLTILVFTVSAFAGITLNSRPEVHTGTFIHNADITLNSRPGAHTGTYNPGTRDILYEQLANISAEGGISAQDFEAAFDIYDAEGADEFIVPAGETWTINEVVILGSYSTTGPCDLANVRFYADDAGGIPGTLLFEYLDVPANPTATGDLDCFIPDTVLPEGTYWLGFQGDMEFGLYGQWYWTRQAAPTIGYEFHWQNPGGGFGGLTSWGPGSVQWPGQFDYNLSFGIYGTIGGATTLNPPQNLFVDDTGYATWDAPVVSGAIYSDDFESYTVGDYLAVQSADWTTWSNAPGGPEDALISDVQALSGSNSVVVEGTSDLVLIMDNYTSGVYSMELNLLVPTGYCGYWNLQKTNTIGQEWAFQIMFDVTGIATGDAGAAAAFTFPFSFDTWINMELIVDLDADWCEIWVDGVMLHGYQWTLGTFGTPGLLSFGGMNLYAWASAGNSPMCYFDDIELNEVTTDTRDLLGYNVSLDGGFVTFTADEFYQYTGLTNGITYLSEVTALYDEGESASIDYTFTYSASTVYTLPFAENFEGGVIPVDWTMTTLSAVGWFITTDGSSTYWPIPPGDGFYACSNDDAANDDGSMDYLITPEFDLTGETGTTLTFDSFYDGAYGQIATVEASTDGSTWTIVNTLAPGAAWETLVVDLSAYDGAPSVWFAFHSDDAGYWSSGWAFDNVSIESSAPTICTYMYSVHANAGNPGSLNTDSDSSTTGWTEICPAAQAANIWGAPQTIPFDFEYFCLPVTDFKASLNGLVTFDIAAPDPPADVNNNLPSVDLPDNTMAMFWDNFTLNPPTGSNDRVYTKLWGTAPDRQLWIKYHSFEYGGYSFCYFAMAIEETTNNIYFVDMNYWSGSGDATVGVQYDVATAIEVSGSPNIAFGAGGSSNSDNTYYQFVPVPEGVPTYPSNPSPPHGATQVAASGDLMWDFGDNTETYDLWFGPAGAMVEVVSGATSGTSGTYPYSGLASGTLYEWQLILHNSLDYTIDGPLWSFTTENNPIFVQVGDGTAVSEELPIEPYYGYSYSNVIYLASEIYATGDITGVQYQYQSNAGFGDPDDIVIWLGHTTQSEFIDGDDWIDNTTMTEVFNGQLHFPPAAGDWFQIVFPVPFTYNGTDNLVIAWDENTTGYHSSSDDFFCTATTPIRGICYYNDSTNPDPLAPPTANAVRNFIANVRLNDLVQPFGTLDGYVYESGTTNGILNAEVTCAGASAITDATGYYIIPVVSTGTHDATADHADYFPETVSVVITEGVTTAQNFGLEWAEIIVDPLLIDISILPEATDDQLITLTNNGPHELAYSVGLNFISDRNNQSGTKSGAIETSIYNGPTGVSMVADNDPLEQIQRRKETLSDDIWDLQFAYDVDTPSGMVGLSGCETDGTYLYATKWNGVGEIAKFDLAGNFIETFIIPGVEDLRDLAYDGQYMYGSDASNYIWEMDFNTQTLISTITTPASVRSIAYDSDLDGFWYNNFSTDLHFVDRTGALLNTITAPPSLYGCAYDNLTAGGPYLWIFTGTSSGGGCQVEQYDLNTLTLTGVTHSVSGDLGDYIAGGLFLQPDIIAGTYTLGGLAQGTPDLLFGYELGVTETWMTVGDPGPGVVAGSGGTAQVTIHFDAAGLILGDIKTGEVIINHNAVTGGPEVLPVTMTVEEAYVAPDVFFSEYIEGSSNNKAIEIYNNTGDVINLDDYRIAQSVNGGGWAYWHIFPAGATLANEDVWVILNEDCDPALFDPADADEVLAYPSVVHHNGDDARGLEWTPDGGTTWVLGDIIGDPDEDPGAGWPVAGVADATQNHTLVRKDEITTGNTDWLVAAGTTPEDSEWIVHPQDTFDYLGWHIVEPDEFNPPTNVFVNDETWLLTWEAPEGAAIFADNFDSYTAGDFLCTQSTDWFTWANTPGGADDAYVVDVQSNSPSNSLEITGVSDIIHPFGDLTTGAWDVSFMMYIEPTYGGYFNLLHEFTEWRTVRTEWALEAYFGSTGSGDLHAGGTNAATFTHPVGSWFEVKTEIDLDADWAEFYVDGVFVHAWQWSLTSQGTPGLLQLGAIDIFAAAPTGETPLFYIDDFAHTIMTTERVLSGFNVYLDDMLIPLATVGADVYEYQYEELLIGQPYVAGVSALYEDPTGESDIIEFPFTPVPPPVLPPENLTVEIVTFNDVLLNWEAPGGVTGEWIGWDNGTSGNSIGLTAGGTFYVASRWDPAALAPYDGYELTKIMFFPASDVPTTYELMVWTGVNASTLVLTQPVTTFVYNDFNEIDLDTPVLIDASDELWFGYATNHVAGEHPAGTDPGPAVAGYGDMISMDGSTWDSLAGLGLDYNWNLQGYVMGSDGEKIALTPPQRTRKVTPVRFNSNVQLSVAHNAIRRTNTTATDDLRLHLGYNVYKDGVEIEYILGPEILTYTDFGVEPGVREYYVTAVYDEGESVPSNTESVEIILPIPQNPEANFTYPNVLVTWDPISDGRNFASYSVYRDADPTAIATGITSTMYVDSGLPNGFYFYNVTAVYDGDYESDWSEDSNIVEVVESGNILIPVRTELTGNYPNPFNPETTIQFSLKEDSDVSIKIYNIKGAVVRTLVDGEMKASYHKIIWDSKDNTGKQVGSGLYFYKMISEGNSGDYTSTKKMILLK